MILDDSVESPERGMIVPDDVAFQTKPKIALQQMREMLAAGVSPAVVLAKPAYGDDGKFRRGITALGLPYVAGAFSRMLAWRPRRSPTSAPIKPP